LAIDQAKRTLVSLLQNFVALYGMTLNLSRESSDAAVRTAYSARAFTRASRAPARAGVRAPADPPARAAAHPRIRAPARAKAIACVSNVALLSSAKNDA
jgi:hypothetical protein